MKIKFDKFVVYARDGRYDLHKDPDIKQKDGEIDEDFEKRYRAKINSNNGTIGYSLSFEKMLEKIIFYNLEENYRDKELELKEYLSLYLAEKEKLKELLKSILN